MTKTVCIVQARMTSSRLPGKVLEDLAGKTVLAHVLERCAATPGVNQVVVAIPDEQTDEPVVQEATRLGFPVWRGSRDDVLSRFHGAAHAFGADIILRVTSDCPLTDPAVNGQVLALVTTDIDYACNAAPPLWPHGLEAEAFTLQWLDRAHREARRPSEREHVGPFIRNHPAARKATLPGPGEPECLWRWTLDTPDDLVFLRTLFSRMPVDENRFSWSVPAAIMHRYPELASINAGHDRLEGLKKSLRADALRTSKTAIIRCDADPRRGGGHLMRCLNLSHGLSAMGWSCHFAVAAGSFEATGRTKPPGTLELSGDSVMDPDALRHWMPDGCDLLVVDHYDLGITWEQSLYGWARTLLSLDDIPGRPHCGAVLSAIPLPPAGPGPWLCGPDWAILNPAFQAVRHKALERRKRMQPVERIVVSFGLTDPDNTTSLVLGVLRTAGRGLSIDVVIGSGSPWLEAIRATAAQCDPPAQLHIDADNIPALLLEADMAIGAGGVSAFERCCLGLPSILIQIADNQKETSALLSDHRAALDLGSRHDLRIDDLERAIQALIHNPGKRAAMAQTASSLCDGRGLLRAMCALFPVLTPTGSSVILYPAQPATQKVQGHDHLVSDILVDGQKAGSLTLEQISANAGNDDENAKMPAMMLTVSLETEASDVIEAALILARRLAPQERFHVRKNIAPDTILIQAGYTPRADNLFVQEPSS
ncbi:MULTISPECIES: UDP-2,4-diacetamido-2,4,6-trideoxy-beta-L-altropyranose hydrolase [unclassified Haematospirillum]|uniref:UDP-2,4-diacetamido-2,4, 6-trideoxy-beta-L-altropyranose hydrolase n=1 Tax=unclassified Haematospirillum TaxID=2622088 RepID=UPI0014391B39|nr:MULTISPECIES: UDP-2,4-diacetamido-2,4,6-trideoxy-beta-L-altropyranose hydrolase [unclassified Haematospirillum]NKD55315.1 UDP-2,4-diacetamido-2,4,6-trideoxy-beta-L-altropyranose hydrolase [Haematospirillum sp. H4890]NKD75534.1 UDP-2,4-diacetamido-2,4,6-trideoxy-beta-L-altropyranose hydrolase [Haematospirillum sp. H4485]